MSKKRYSGNDIIKALTSKNFNPKNTHHVNLVLRVSGKGTLIRTRISHSQKSKELSKHTHKEIARQLKFVDENNKIDWDNFYRFIDCPMDYEEYVKYLKQNNHI